MDRRERVADPEEAQRMARDGQQARMWTALPGIIQSFDPVRMVCNVQPSINGVQSAGDGTTSALQMPMLLDCPVVFPGGGGVTLTFPLAAGDECLVVFASRCIDSWWQLGGVQGQAEFRMHNLSDGFVLPGVRSQPRAFTVAPAGAQLRTDDGSAYVEVDSGSHAVKVITSGDITATAGGSATLTAPTITLNGNTTVNGTLAVSQTIAAGLDVTGNGGTHSLGAHHHTVNGVQTGSSNVATTNTQG